MFAQGGASTSPAAVLDSAEVCRRWSDPELLRQSIEDQIDYEGRPTIWSIDCGIHQYRIVDTGFIDSRQLFRYVEPN